MDDRRNILFSKIKNVLKTFNQTVKSIKNKYHLSSKTIITHNHIDVKLTKDVDYASIRKIKYIKRTKDYNLKIEKLLDVKIIDVDYKVDIKDLIKVKRTRRADIDIILKDKIFAYMNELSWTSARYDLIEDLDILKLELYHFYIEDEVEQLIINNSDIDLISNYETIRTGTYQEYQFLDADSIIEITLSRFEEIIYAYRYNEYITIFNNDFNIDLVEHMKIWTNKNDLEDLHNLAIDYLVSNELIDETSTYFVNLTEAAKVSGDYINPYQLFCSILNDKMLIGSGASNVVDATILEFENIADEYFETSDKVKRAEIDELLGIRVDTKETMELMDL